MARLNAAERRALPASDFAGPGRSFPDNDRVHAEQAIRMSGHKSPAEAAKIKAAVYRKYPDMKKAPAYKSGMRGV